MKRNELIRGVGVQLDIAVRGAEASVAIRCTRACIPNRIPPLELPGCPSNLLFTFHFLLLTSAP
jgi:hypothetical protein